MIDRSKRRDFFATMASIGSLVLAGCLDESIGGGDSDPEQDPMGTQSATPGQQDSTDSDSDSQSGTPSNTSVPCQDTRPDLYEHDLHVENRIDDAIQVRVTITPESGTEAGYTETFTVNPGQKEYVIDIDIDPGVYEIQAELVDSEASDSFTYEVSDLEGRYFVIEIDERDEIIVDADYGTVVVTGTESNPC